MDPRTPVLVGVGQIVRRPDGDGTSMSPTALMAEALRRAGDDSGTGTTLLRAATSIRVVDQMSWRYANPAAEVAEMIGCEPPQTVVTTVGGNSPQLLVNHTALDIAAGRMDIALICGAEAIYSRFLARKSGTALDWPSQDGHDVPAPDDVIGIDRPGVSPEEQAKSLLMPTQIYPLFECALRAAAGETIDQHQVRISELWARFSEVASTNPYSWSTTPRSAEEIRTVTPDNRMIGFPYPKLMNANIQTDQGAALILCSVAAAERAGVPRDRWVFPWAGVDGHDHWFVSDRWDLCSSPAIEACGRALWEMCGLGPDDLGLVDLYSCFPSAVQIGAAALGLALDDPTRPVTVTGGLTFAGGPGNNYSTHAIATMAGKLRQQPATIGLVTALGWYATKHSIGVYSASPPTRHRGFVHRDVQAAVDPLPRRGIDSSHTGPVTIEASTVMHERDGTPALGIVAGLTPAGRRTWANSVRPDLLRELIDRDCVGRGAKLRADGDLDLS